MGAQVLCNVTSATFLSPSVFTFLLKNLQAGAQRIQSNETLFKSVQAKGAGTAGVRQTKNPASIFGSVLQAPTVLLPLPAHTEHL